MESVLHIEPITRQSPAPLHIGHTQSLLYGEKLTIDEENIGEPTSSLILGSPLCTLDFGSPQSCVPLVKTIDYSPDLSRKEGFVYRETIHYLKDKKYLIPFRSKIRSGLGQGIRFNHLPSLNLVRSSIAGPYPAVCDPRSEIVSDVLLHDEIFQRSSNHPLKEWLATELSQTLDLQTVSTLSFDPSHMNSIVPRYINQVRSTPTDYNARHLKEITNTIFPLTGKEGAIPPAFRSPNPLGYSLGDVRSHLVDTPFNFKSFGSIPVRKLDRVEYNPMAFQHICDLIDQIPLTDFNIDLVFSTDSEVVVYCEHMAIDRLNVFADNESGLYQPESIFREYIAEYEISRILECFVTHHRCLSDEIRRTIEYDMIKIKFMKTITDEAAILLYTYDSAPNDPPLCGVYFDIALQSLAPLTIMNVPQPVDQMYHHA